MSNHPKKILIFSHAYFPNWIGGAEIALKEITDRIPADECEFHLITLGSTESVFEKMGNISVHRMRIFGSRARGGIFHILAKYIFIFAAFFKGVQLQREYHFDAFWTLMATYGGFSALFMKLAYPKKEFLLTLQEGDPIEYIMKRLGAFKFLYKQIFKKADKVQAISGYLAEFAHTMGFRGEVSVVPNAVDTKHFYPNGNQESVAEIRNRFVTEGETLLVTASRLVVKNGVEDVIRALPVLAPNVKFLILGSGELGLSLKRLVIELGLEGRVFFLGHVTHAELPNYLRASDIFIRPSLSEGLGNAFLEAMACGLPVIATNVGGIPDFLTDNETGVFCFAKNPGSIADAVHKLEDPELKKHITETALKMVQEKYTWDRIAGGMRGLLG